MRKALTIADLNAPRSFVTPNGVTLTRSPLALGDKAAPARSFDWKSIPSWVEQAVEGAVEDRLPTYVWGQAGTGKDYAGEALAFLLNRPLVALSVKPGVDPNDWVGGVVLENDNGVTVSRAKNGFLAEAVDPKNKVAPVVVLSDFDRASPAQVEVFRQAFETDPARRYLTHPTTGAMFPIHPDTIWWLTGNTSADGEGANQGGMIASPLDTSIRNRLIATQAEAMSVNEEAAMIAAAFPTLGMWSGELAQVCKNLRSAIAESGLPMEFSIRTWHQVFPAVARKKEKGVCFKDAVEYGLNTRYLSHLGGKDNKAMLLGSLEPIFRTTLVG
jgi:hypothetical protein